MPGGDVEREALAWLYALADQERGVGWNPRSSADEQWKLGRTRAMLDLAGAPDRRLRVVLVGGTKGKGSTAAMLASILNAAGARVGLYTKPHLQSYRERVRVDGQAISPADFGVAVERAQALVDRLADVSPEAGEPTTFEVTTALALEHFARVGCEIGVIEVGLGGRLDATNALDPELSIITSISRDHTAVLGNTLALIAAEKAGILRRGRPALLARQRPSATRVLLHACARLGADCREIEPLAGDVPLVGHHQRQNAALAIEAARALVGAGDDTVRRGLYRLRWPGRFEVVDGPPTVVLDGAHNDASAQALAKTLVDVAAGQPVLLVLGLHRDKDARGVLRPLLAVSSGIWLTRAAESSRALPPGELAALTRRLVGPSIDLHVEESLPSALTAARAAAAAGGLVCVTGSLAIVGQARSALGLPIPERLWE